MGNLERPVRPSRLRRVDGGAGDCHYTYMRNLVAGSYRLPWEDEVVDKYRSNCGLPSPDRRYKEAGRD